jgi:hypothetical protein
MPVVVKLSPEEVRTERNRGKSQRKIVSEQYDTMLEGFSASDWGEVQLDAEEKRATVRNRLKAAAERRGFGIRFKRGQGNQMRFEIVNKDAVEVSSDDSSPADAEVAEEPVSSVAPPAPAKQRRTRKSASADQASEGVKRRPGRPKTNA